MCHTKVIGLCQIFGSILQKNSGMAVEKFWDQDGVINTLKATLRSSQGAVEFINNTSQEVKIFKKDMIGILDLRLLGYFKVNYKDLVKKLGQQFTFFHYYKNETIYIEKDSFIKLETNLDTSSIDPYH